MVALKAVSSVEEYKEIISKNKLVVIDYFATWCGPCRMIAPQFAEMSNSEQFKDVVFLKVDVDDLPAISEEAGVSAMPTFKIFKDGVCVETIVGASIGPLQQAIIKAQGA